MRMGMVNKLRRVELWAELRKRGVAKVSVEFSGGGDEGGVGDITLFNAAGEEIGTLEERYPVWNGKEWVHKYPSDPDLVLVETLCSPVYEKYGTFAGEFYVSGTVDYDVEAGTVKMSYSETVEEWEEVEE